MKPGISSSCQLSPHLHEASGSETQEKKAAQRCSQPGRVTQPDDLLARVIRFVHEQSVSDRNEINKGLALRQNIVNGFATAPYLEWATIGRKILFVRFEARHRSTKGRGP